MHASRLAAAVSAALVTLAAGAAPSEQQGDPGRCPERKHSTGRTPSSTANRTPIPA